MEPLSFIERFTKLFQIIFTSSFFIVSIIVIVLTVIVLIVDTKVKNKTVRLVALVGYVLIFSSIIFQYGKSILLIGDSLFDNIFTTIYFPNIISYLCMMVIAAILCVISVISNKLSNVIRISNIMVVLILIILFVFSLDIIVKQEINIYAKASVYANESLTILIQTSTGLFTVWVVLLGIDLLIKYIVHKSPKNPEELRVSPKGEEKTKKNKVQNKTNPSKEKIEPKDKKISKETKPVTKPKTNVPKQPQLNMDEVGYLTDEDFNKSMKKFKKEEDQILSKKKKSEDIEVLSSNKKTDDIEII